MLRAPSIGQLRGGAVKDEAKNAEVLAAIKQAKDMLGQGPMLAGVEAKSINSGILIPSQPEVPIPYILHTLKTRCCEYCACVRMAW